MIKKQLPMKKVLLLLLFAHSLFAQPSYHFNILKDINTQTNDSKIVSIQNAGDKAIIFQADRNYNDDTYKLRLWEYNGLRLENFASSDLFGEYASFSKAVSIDDYIFFYANSGNGDSNKGLYVANLNSSVIKKVAFSIPVFVPNVVKMNAKFYYTAYSDYGNGKLFYYNENTNESVEIQGATKNFRNPTGLQIVNNQLFFTALAAEQYNTNELWVSDGTNAGTHKVKELAPLSHIYNSAVKLGNRVMYHGFNDIQTTISISDGTEAGTYIFKNAQSFDNSPNSLVTIHDLHSFGNKVMILLSTREESQVWITDGTDANTRLIDNYRSICFFENGQLATKDGFVFFTNASGELVKTDGVTKTVLGNGFPEITKMAYNPLDNNLYYFSLGKIYKTDGLEIKLVSDKLMSITVPIPYTIGAGKLIAWFNPSNNSKYGKELYTVATDSIKIVKDLDSTTRTSKCEFLLNANEKSYFLAYDNIDSTYKKVYETDGTAEGTRGAGIGNLAFNYHFVAFRNDLYLLRNNQVQKVDFTSGNYQIIANLTGSLATPKPVQINNKFYFITSGQTIFDGQLWASDGTTAGTTPIRMFNQSDTYQGIAVYNQQLYVFIGTNNGTKIWKYANDNSQPILVKTINTYAIRRTYANFQGKLAFIATISGGTELWTTDGTDAGTIRHHYLPFSINSNLERIYFTDRHYYYSVYTYSDSKVKVYKSDGTLGGTMVIFDVSNATSDITDFCQCNSEVLFGLNQEMYSGKSFLYKHNPVNGMTALVKETDEIVETTRYKNFYCLNRRLYFTTYGGGAAGDKKKLYTSDGTSDETKSILLLEKKLDYSYYFTNGILHPLNDHELLIRTDDRFYDLEWFTFRKCETSLTNLDGVITDSKIQTSSTFIESTEKITSENSVYYFAPRSITLNAGFSANNQSIFKAEIKNKTCTLRQ